MYSKIKKSKPTHRVIALFLICAIVFGATYISFTGRTALGSSGLSLGESGSNLATAEDFVLLSKLVADGDDMLGRTLYLNADVDLSEVVDWIPIGTKNTPFRGTFDGNNHTIRGIGTTEHPTLFGYLEDATIKNLNLIIPENGTSPGLAISTVNTTIENVLLLQGEPLFSRAMTFSVPGDQSWYLLNTGTTIDPYRINDAAQLLGLLELVENGTDNFQGKFIELAASINMENIPWIGIGTKEKPFMGTIRGTGTGISAIKNLNVYNPGTDNIGLFGYTDSARIERISLENANVIGGNNVGGILGYGKDSYLTDCRVAGSVQGSNYVGGLVGNMEITAAFVPVSGNATVEWGYTTAKVTGTLSVGGIIGRLNTVDATVDAWIKDCFSTGNVAGVISCGGVMGISEGPHSRIYECASSGTIRGSGLMGGVLGTGDGNGFLNVENSYTSSTVYASSDSGAIAGGLTVITNSYTNGHIVSPVGVPDYYITAGVGFSGSTSFLYREPNTIYRTANYMNQNPATSDNGKFGSNAPSGTNEIFSANTTGSTLPTSSFTLPSAANALVYNPLDPLDHSTNIAISGTYPKLTNFATATGNRAAFARFSDITTNAVARNIPAYLHLSSDGTHYSASKGGSVIKLPALSGVEWKIATNENPTAGTSVSVEDATLDSANIISIVTAPGSSDKTIKADFPLNKSQEILLSAVVTQIPGLEVKYTINLSDEAVRILGSAPEIFYPDIASANAGNMYASDIDTLHHYYFDEPIEFTTPGTTATATIHVHDDNEFTNPAVSTEVVNLKIINDTILELSWDSSIILENTGYCIDLTAEALIRDKSSRNLLDGQIYFCSQKLMPPIITFVPNYELEVPSESTPTHQVVEMKENDIRYGINGYTEGIDVQNADSPAFSAQEFSFQTVTSAFGSGPYTGTVLNEATFHKYPGEYIFTYTKINTASGLEMKSSELKRTYRVEGEVMLTQGGKAVNVFTEEISPDKLIELYEKNSNLSQSINDYLVEKYLNTSGANQLKALQYDHTGKPNNKAITFDTSIITQDILNNGYEGLLYYDVEGMERQAMIIKIGAIGSKYEIIIPGGPYIAENTMSRVDAIAEFGAYVIDKSDPLTKLDMTIIYKWRDINPTKYAKTQELTLYIQEGYGETIAGVDMSVENTAIVVINKVDRYINDPEKRQTRENETVEFWDTRGDWVRAAKANSTYNFDIDVFDATNMPADFFRIMNNQDNATVNINFPNDIKLTMKSKNIDSSLLDQSILLYNMNIEEMYSLYVKRDAGGDAVQQFRTLGEFNIPGSVTLTMPLDQYLPKEDLNLYRIDNETNEYVLLKSLSSREIANGTLTLELEKFEGEYVITATDLDGITSSRPHVNFSAVPEGQRVASTVVESTSDEEKEIVADPVK